MRDNWEQKKLKDVCYVITDGTHKTPKYTNEGIRFISIKNIKPFRPINWQAYVKYISLEEHNELIKRCKPEVGDILFPRIGTLGYAKRIDFSEDVSLFVGLGLLKPNHNIIESSFLEYYMNSPFIYKLSHEKATGAGRQTLALKSTREFPVPIPPLEEQKEIVEILDQTFESIEKAKANIEKNIENAKELFESRQKKYFDELSENLVLTPILEACEKIFAGGDKPKDYFSKTKTSDYQIPVISNGEKNDGLYGFTKTPKVTKPSVTVSARGTIGFTVFRNYPFVPIVRLIVLTPNEDIIIPEFLMRVLKTLDILRTGSSIPQLTVPMIKTYSIPVPDLEKQKEIVETLDIIDNHIQSLLATCEEELKNLEDLKKSILQKAFSGELTNKNKAA